MKLWISCTLILDNNYLSLQDTFTVPSSVTLAAVCERMFSGLDLVYEWIVHISCTRLQSGVCPWEEVGSLGEMIACYYRETILQRWRR